ncbi:MAG: discoidin domain-containing protein [Verrucomicrobia bacterium]|nr:MAG: discoidin domain-containing protein [Verrucomicrobiota bacterium]TAE87384.1 MAG: discoidin domain-containing protein [Verrucomicrobiota bacterium]TAF25238.1 MAG: discoidin domain-containing protein [Verrucomicrobiota bacterium]TAF40885.1 MAG: discoidin domain-containing protein [Verrucomicrobiota bacterium]
MKAIIPIFVVAALVPTFASPLEGYKVRWDTPSIDSLDSMPLSGRMGAGANVWVQDGSIWLYLAHGGAFDERGRLLKLGCVRITPQEVELGKDGFVQELDPATGTISIIQEDFKASLWFAGETLIYESEHGREKPLEVSFATWRDRDKSGLKLDMFREAEMKADRISADESGFVWWHRNADHGVDVAGLGEGRGIEKAAVFDATSRRVSGGAIAVAGGIDKVVESPVQWQFWEGRAWTGKTLSRRSQRIAMRLDAAIGAAPEQWRAEARTALKTGFVEMAKADEVRRWREFWSRSHVRINPAAGEDDAGFLIGRNYQLFRYMLAANRDGELPFLFNGGIFTPDNKPGRITGNNNDELPISQGGPSTPDFRRWMFCCFMSQNQRWLGWPNLANGDADLLSPSVKFYRDRSPAAFSRAKRQGAAGAVYVEPLDIWGLCSAEVGPRPDGLTGAEHLTYHFSMGLEHAWMALQAHDTLGIDLSEDLPWIQGVAGFYDSFYRAQGKQRNGRELGDDDKLVIYPSNGLEYAGDATNPVDAVSGLLAVSEGLLRYPGLDAAARERCEKLLKVLPPIPTARRQGRLAVLPAKTYTKGNNHWEPIEHYAAWPYRRIGITRPDSIQLLRDTWDSIPEVRGRLCKQDYSWMANLVNAASMASPEQAKQRAIYKMANTAAPQARFPAFFGPGHDWLPDFNWGGSGMTGVQEMLLAPEPGKCGKLHLFGGWPTEWDVDFKLHAPGKTVVEASLKGGKLVSLKVTPESRKKDIVNWLGKHPEWKPFTRPASLAQGKPINASSQFAEPGYDAKLANDGDPKTRWSSDYAARSGSLEIDLGAEREIGSFLISEIEWKETREFTIEVKQGDVWKEVARGTSIGPDKEIPIPAVKARAVRLNILKATNAININEFQALPPGACSASTPGR